MLKQWMIEMTAESAYKHGQGYAKGNVYRSLGRWIFKNPEAIGLENWVTYLPLKDHQFLADLYRHAFRQGLKSI